MPAWRLLVTLGVAGALAGFLLVFVFQVTAPIIERNKAERLAAAVQEVLKGPVRYDTLFVIDDRLTDVLPDGVDARSFDQVYRGYDADGQLIGYAMAAGEPGFQDIVRLIFGYDYATSTLLALRRPGLKSGDDLSDTVDQKIDNQDHGQ